MIHLAVLIISILTRISSCADYNEEILNELKTAGKKIEIGNDDLRVRYVNMQGCIEHQLACALALGEIDQLAGVIHTPMPATPLCIKPQEGYEEILDESIRNDPQKLYTVLSRAKIVREYLTKGAKLYIAYPQGGLEKRNGEQQNTYREELERYSGTLVDTILNDTQIPPEMIGATYLFRSEGQVYAFSIQSRQVNDIQALTEWGLWFGPVDHPEIAARVDAVFDYLSQAGGPDLRQEFSL
ncbi:MAG: hypothetical protein JSS32_08620 [Verrucomicrobia bacterium]|nr:hypothetical protein [Verrucomicrobiota bacterium]